MNDNDAEFLRSYRRMFHSLLWSMGMGHRGMYDLEMEVSRGLTRFTSCAYKYPGIKRENGGKGVFW